MATLTICDGCREQGRVKVLNGTSYAHVPFLGDKRRYLDLCGDVCEKAYAKYKFEVEHMERVERLSARARKEKHLSEFYGRLRDGTETEERPTKKEADNQILKGSERYQQNRIVEPGAE